MFMKCRNKEDLQQEFKSIKDSYNFHCDVERLTYYINHHREQSSQMFLPFIPISEKDIPDPKRRQELYNQYENLDKYPQTIESIPILYSSYAEKNIIDHVIENYCEFNEYGYLTKCENLEDSADWLFPWDNYPPHQIYQDDNDPTIIEYAYFWAYGGPNEYTSYFFKITPDSEEDQQIHTDNLKLIKITHNHNWWSPTISIDITDDPIALEWIDPDTYHAGGYSEIIERIVEVWNDTNGKINEP